ncbi:pleckstrin homology domain-containing family N member 1 [Eudromia elegans]
MGNVACVPPAPGRLRGSFRRKPSLRKEKDGKKKLPSFFGTEGGRERDTTTDKILQYIPAKNIQNQEIQKENLDQRFPSLFKKGRRKTVVRNLGKIIYYSKVKFKFQHCQEVNDCYLELFQSYLYFQSLGSNGLTYQGLLPLKELHVCEIGTMKGPEDHAFRITGPLVNPLIVFCPTESELQQWLYHLEKQIQLNGGSLGLPLLSPSAWKGSSLGKEELRWSVQNMPVEEWRGTQRESLGDVLCVSKVKLQHLPFQEQHERLLVLYPSTLVIVSEEGNCLYFKGELPLNAVQVRFDEDEKSSFLIEGRLINSIRVTCPSYGDYQEWLYCLKTAQFRNAHSSLSECGSASGSRLPHGSPAAGSGRGSLASDGRTSSWVSRGTVAAPARVAQPDGALVLDSRALPGPPSPGYSQPRHKKNSQPLLSSQWREVPVAQRYSSPGTSCPLYLGPPEDAPYFANVPSLREEHWGASLQPPGEAFAGAGRFLQRCPCCVSLRMWRGLLLLLYGVDTYDLPEPGCARRDSASSHDYAELQSFQSDLSYDNLWDAEGKEPPAPLPFPVPAGQRFYQA